MAGFNVDYRARLTFADKDGRPVDPATLSQVVIRSSAGSLHGSRRALRRSVAVGTKTVDRWVTHCPSTLCTRSAASGCGSNIVNELQQRFIPAEDPELKVQLLFFSGTFAARDAIFGFPVGSAIRPSSLDGHSEIVPLGAGKEVTPPPRGEYEVTVRGGGLRVSAPVAPTRSQRLDLKFVTWLDLAVVAVAAVAFLAGLPWLRWRLQRSRPASRWWLPQRRPR